MAWNPTYAAHRYFRKRGDIVMTGTKLLIYNTPPRDNAAHAHHVKTLRELGYDFTNSLFIETTITDTKPPSGIKPINYGD